MFDSLMINIAQQKIHELSDNISLIAYKKRSKKLVGI